MFLLADASTLGMMAIALATLYAACWGFERNRMNKRIDALEAKLKSLESKISSPETDDAIHAAMR